MHLGTCKRSTFWWIYAFLIVAYVTICSIYICKVDVEDIVKSEDFINAWIKDDTFIGFQVGLFLFSVIFYPFWLMRLHDLNRSGKILFLFFVVDVANTSLICAFSLENILFAYICISLFLYRCLLFFMILSLLAQKRGEADNWRETFLKIFKYIMFLIMFIAFCVMAVDMLIVMAESDGALGGLFFFIVIFAVVIIWIQCAFLKLVARGIAPFFKKLKRFTLGLIDKPYDAAVHVPSKKFARVAIILSVAISFLGVLLIVHPHVYLSMATRCGNERIVKLLIKNRITKYTAADAQEYIDFAIKKEHMDIVHDLLCADREVLASVDVNAHLLYAVRRGHVEATKFLLTLSNVDVNVLNMRYRTPLEEAVEAEYIEIIKLLLAVPEIELSNNKALKMAQEKGNEEIIRLITEAQK